MKASFTLVIAALVSNSAAWGERRSNPATARNENHYLSTQQGSKQIERIGDVRSWVGSPRAYRSTREDADILRSFQIFQSAASSIEVKEDTFTCHPLVDFLVASITEVGEFGGEPDYLSICRSVLSLERRLSVFPDSSSLGLAKALTLARGLYQLGHWEEALKWISFIERADNEGEFKAMARALRILHFSRMGDVESLLGLSEHWDGWDIRSDEERSAMVCLLSAIYLIGADSSLTSFTKRTSGLGPYGSFFKALLFFGIGEYGEARKLLSGVLEDKIPYPASMKLAALMLAAAADRESGLGKLARRELELLMESRSRFVRSWASFHLGMIDMENNDYASALRRFKISCSVSKRNEWADLFCLYREYMARNSGVMEGIRDGQASP